MQDSFVSDLLGISSKFVLHLRQDIDVGTHWHTDNFKFRQIGRHGVFYAIKVQE